MNWEKKFPFEKPRHSQKLAIEAGLECLKEKKFFVLEAGTGVGKSAIAYTIAEIIGSQNCSEGFEIGSCFITTQKILQQQYVRDFENLGLKSITSSSNFSCRHNKQNTCAQSMRVLGKAPKGSRFWNTCMFKCPYRITKQAFIDSKMGVTNFPYFLAETSYAGKIKPRKVLVVDEAHNTASELGKFIEITVTEKFSNDFLKTKMPDIKSHVQAIKWVKEVYHPLLFKKFKFMKDRIEKLQLGSRINEIEKIARQFELVDKHLCKMNRFIQLHDNNNWVFNLVLPEGKKGRKLEFKPIDVAPFSDELLFKYGEKVVMMSATILNKKAFCETLGINQEDVGFIQIESPFPKKNRPVLFFPVGKMVKRDLDETLPKLAEAVSKILENHSNEKGIIHCHTFKIANYLKNNVKSNRLLIHNSENRDSVLKRHIDSKKKTVLLSPSMTEGVDLKGEQSRFQILCKIPYPYLGDKLVSKRMNRWKWWYSLQTAKTILQSVGRSVRSEDDHAVTYILDSAWEDFYRKNSQLFPPDFKLCIL